MIREIEVKDIFELAKLFVEVFNVPLWDDRWNSRSAATHLRQIYDTPGFYGIVGFEGDEIDGQRWTTSNSTARARATTSKRCSSKGDRRRQGLGSALLD